MCIDEGTLLVEAAPGSTAQPLRQLIAMAVDTYCRRNPDSAMAAPFESLLPLCHRIDSLVISLADEIAWIDTSKGSSSLRVYGAGAH